MSTLLAVLLLCCITCTCSLSHRDGILVATYAEILSIHKNNINNDGSDAFYDYLSKPLIITESPMINWTLYDGLDDIYNDAYNIECQQQQTNCSCIEEQTNDNTLCEEFASTFLYSARHEDNYAHWRPFEASYNISAKYEKCVNTSIGEIGLKKAYKSVKASLINMHLYKNEIKIADKLNVEVYDRFKNEYKKSYSYLRVLSMQQNDNFKDKNEDRKHETYIESIHLNVLDRIGLSPYFKVFNINGFENINDMHIWFGMHYYRAIRHYDKPNNLFFVLKGSRKFRLSLPTGSMFPFHPLGHQSYRQQYPNYEILDNDEYKEGCFIDEKYEINEIELYENEMLYMPGYWFHEIINDNFSCALSMWWDSKDQIYSKEILDYKLPINPNADEMSVADIDEFLYFIQNLIDKWCDRVKDEYINHNLLLKCNEYDKNEGGFLLSKYKKIYPLLDDLSYDTFEWDDIGLDIENILKCAKGRIEDYGTILQFKEDLYICFMFQDDEHNTYQNMWDKSVDDIIDMHFKYSHIGIADLQFVEYLEIIMLALSDDVNILPIWIAFIKL